MLLIKKLCICDGEPFSIKEIYLLELLCQIVSGNPWSKMGSSRVLNIRRERLPTKKAKYCNYDGVSTFWTITW